ncbi:hypothetical protein ABMC89_13295 [Sulfitobacter sp. HNIBRBA3233]|uniref:hypothetical protein n=1 Tax=Sulfitobacter marinivivus TaxID=3158558 RepID=UPI0032DED601
MEHPDYADIQGNILRGYRRHLVRHLMLEVTDAKAARRFLALAADGGGDGVPAITPDEDWGEGKPPSCFNIGITCAGLRALGVGQNHIATFPTEFVEGMTKRAAKLGDTGTSAPEHWPAPFDDPDRLHIVASIYADVENEIAKVHAQVEKAFTVLGQRDGAGLGEDKVFFGYTDNISQPRFRWVKDPSMDGVDEPIDPLGTILLGYPTRMEDMRFTVPSPQALGLNGSFNAFRVLSQDVPAYEDFLTHAAEVIDAHPDGQRLLPKGGETKVGKGLTRRQALREIVAAQMCGRWRNGVPYQSSPDTMEPVPAVNRTNFDYKEFPRCPAGAHMRRANPRGGAIVQRIASYTRRLVRRGMPYGPKWDPDDPETRNAERGLLGNFIGANPGAQFEAVMCDWINLGLQNPVITGTNDPLLGANDPVTNGFDVVLADGSAITVPQLPRLVHVRGGAYTFLPSLPAIRYLAGLGA